MIVVANEKGITIINLLFQAIRWDMDLTVNQPISVNKYTVNEKLGAVVMASPSNIKHETNNMNYTAVQSCHPSHL